MPGEARKKARDVVGRRRSPLPSSHDESVFATLPGVERLLRVASLHQAADDSIAALEALDQAQALLNQTSAPPAAHAEVSLRTAECLRRRGRLDEALSKARTAVEFASSANDPVLRGRALSRSGDVLAGLARYDEALAACEEAYQLLRLTNEHAEIGQLEIVRGTILARRGDITRSRECFESALFCYRRIDHRDGVALALNNLGLLLKNGPNWADARDFLTRALAVSQAAGNYGRVATHSVNLGILYTKLCDWESAEEHLTRAVSINREVGDHFALAKALLGNALMQIRRGQFERAEELIREARELSEKNKYGRERVLCEEFAGDLYFEQGRLDDARQSYARGLAQALELAPEGDLAPEIKRRLAQLALIHGDFDQARAIAGESYRGAQHVCQGTEAGVALRVLGEALSRKGSLQAAERLLDRSLRQLERTPERYEHANSQIALARHLGLVYAQKGDEAGRALPERAINLMQKAWTFFASVDLQEKAAETQVELARLRIDLGRLDDATRDIARGQTQAEQVGRRDLVRRLESLREVIEERSARTAQLASPEADLITEWGLLLGEEIAGENALERLLQFVANRLESDAAVIAAPVGKGYETEAAIGISKEQARAIVKLIAPFVRENGICLATELGSDSRFAAQAGSILAGVHALAAWRVRLPEGEGLLYLDRRAEDARPYGSSALHLLSLLTGLLGLGLVQIRKERDSRRERESRLDASGTGPFAEYITCHRPLKQVFAHLARVGESTASILIAGETGTGKGLLAHCIHQASSRRDHPFVTVNCAALPEPLLESELFGHVQGSFTGAIRTKRGLFEVADGGTLFLDEICRASLAVQAKLLHVLDSKEVRAVGANHGRRVDTRVICAANIDLRQAIQQGAFLEDLFYRLNDFGVTLPPLRERREDIPLLVQHFYDEASREMRRQSKGISREVMALLLDHPWRGNIRELMQIVRRLVALSEDDAPITADLLPADFHVPPASFSCGIAAGIAGSLGASGSGSPAGSTADGAAAHGDLSGKNGKGLHGAVLDLERELLSSALASTGWNRSEVARRLGISYPSVLAKIKRFGLKPPKAS